MSSAIASIYDALAATSITVNSTSVAVKDADELPNSVPAANLPVRLLTVMNTNGTELNVRSDTIGGDGYSMPTIVFWRMADVMLWRKIGTDIGVKAHSKEIVSYAAEYIDMLRTFVASNGYQVTLMDASALPYNYPEGSDDWFYAFVVTLEIKEDI
jgi:hypothetical protein